MDNDSPLTNFRRELDALATLRDELKLKAHLARAELQTEFDALSSKWLLADEQLQRAKAHVQQDAARLQRELSAFVLDLKKGFHDIKRAFDQT